MRVLLFVAILRFILCVCVELHDCVAFDLVCLYTFSLGDCVCRCLLSVARLRFLLHACRLQVRFTYHT